MAAPTALERSTPIVPGTENMLHESAYHRVRLERARSHDACVPLSPSRSLTLCYTQLSTYPVVKDTLSQAQTLIHSNSYSTALYDRTSALAFQILARLEPLQKRLTPQLEQVDNYANSTLDYVEKRFPQVKAETGELLKTARKPADDAAGLAKSYADGITSVSTRSWHLIVYKTRTGGRCGTGA